MGMASYITIYDLTSQCYYIHVYMLVIIYQWRDHQIFLLHPLPFTKDTLFANALVFSIANMHTIFECLGIDAHTSMMDAGIVPGRIKFRNLWFWHLIIFTLSTTTWMHNDQLGWDRLISLVLHICLSGTGTVPCSFILTLLIQQGCKSSTILSF